MLEVDIGFKLEGLLRTQLVIHPTSISGELRMLLVEV
jgi:hypothetical protein